MPAHVLVALLAVAFGYLFLRSRRVYFRVWWGLLWVLFLPNTAYILTDVEHLAHEWVTATASEHLALVLRYTPLFLTGIATFALAAVLPFEKVIRRLSQRAKVGAIVLFNFLVGFGVVLGKWEHINSWVIFTQPGNVALSAAHIFTSPGLLGLMVLMGVICNGVYLLFRKTLLRLGKTLL